jgi:hypothetical protein
LLLIAKDFLANSSKALRPQAPSAVLAVAKLGSSSRISNAISVHEKKSQIINAKMNLFENPYNIVANFEID